MYIILRPIYRCFVFFVILFLNLNCSLFAYNTAFENYLPKNFSKKGNVDYTTYVQEMIDKNSVVVLPNFPILINDGGIRIKSNRKIVFQEKSKLILKPSAKSNYDLLKIINAENIEIINPNLEGDRYTHLSTKGEWGMGIKIQGGKNINIIGGEINTFYGDGIYITRSKQSLSDNIKIKNVSFSQNRRNGISVISGLNVVIENCNFYNTNGTKPMAAIDIEPNSKDDIVNNIVIKRILSRNNGVGIQLGFSRYPESLQLINIEIDGLKSYNDNRGMIIGGYYESYKSKAKLSGTIIIKNIVINNAVLGAISMARYYKYGPEYNFYNIQIYNKKNSKDNFHFFRLNAIERGLKVFN